MAIIGAGKIGACLDHPQSPNVLTHAHGYSVAEGFEIVGFVDRDPRKAESASTSWGGGAFETIEGLFEAENVDAVSVCLPDGVHYETMVELAKRPVRLIFLEKPAVRTAVEADALGVLYSELPIRVLVNYTRRFVPEIRKAKKSIERGDYGSFVTGTGYYGKGLLHNGSHMIDLLQFLLGEIAEVGWINETADFFDDDPSVSAFLSLQSGGTFCLRHVDCRKFNIFEFDLFFEKKRLRICDLGTVMEEYSVGESDLFKGFQTLIKEEEYPTEHRRAMSHAVANIRENLNRNEPLVCTLEESLATVRTCFRILQSRPG